MSNECVNRKTQISFGHVVPNYLDHVRSEN